MYLSTFQVLYKLYLSTEVLKYKVLLPSSGELYLLENVLIIVTQELEIMQPGSRWYTPTVPHIKLGAVMSIIALMVIGALST